MIALFIRTYWQPLLTLAIALFLIGYITILRSENNALRRDNASLQATIDLTKAIGQAANEKAARIEQSAHTATTEITTQYQSTLKKVEAYHAAHPVIKRITVSVRNNPTDSGSSSVSQVPATAQGVTTDRQDTDTAPTGTSVEQSCAVTTLQYNTLHEAWDKACLAFGCN